MCGLRSQSSQQLWPDCSYTHTNFYKGTRRHVRGKLQRLSNRKYTLHDWTDAQTHTRTHTHIHLKNILCSTFCLLNTKTLVILVMIINVTIPNVFYGEQHPRADYDESFRRTCQLAIERNHRFVSPSFQLFLCPSSPLPLLIYRISIRAQCGFRLPIKRTTCNIFHRLYPLPCLYIEGITNFAALNWNLLRLFFNKLERGKRIFGFTLICVSDWISFPASPRHSALFRDLFSNQSLPFHAILNKNFEPT